MIALMMPHSSYAEDMLAKQVIAHRGCDIACHQQDGQTQSVIVAQ